MPPELPGAKRAPITGIRRVPVKSGNIAEIGHDEISGVIEVKFKSGAVWQYPGGFDRHTFDSFRGADSVGKFFNAVILKRQHPQHHICVSQNEDEDSRARKEPS